jgi:hypothetical protein
MESGEPESEKKKKNNKNRGIIAIALFVPPNKQNTLHYATTTYISI